MESTHACINLPTVEYNCTNACIKAADIIAPPKHVLLQFIWLIYIYEHIIVKVSKKCTILEIYRVW